MVRDVFVALLFFATRISGKRVHVDLDLDGVLNTQVAELPVTMDKCTGNIGSMRIGSVSVECESLHELSDVPKAYHCGLMAEAEGNPSIKRRYDLGPRPFQLSINPLDVAAVAIECTEAPKLHGSDTGKAQETWKTAPRRAATRGSTFAQLEDFIRRTQIVAKHYDIVGGNCQHFAFLLYEMMAKLPCYSITVPNYDAFQEIIASHVSNRPVADTIVNALKSFSAQFQKEGGVPLMKDCDK